MIHRLIVMPVRSRGVRRPPRPAFTLIELLVCIAIIAVLTAVLLPALAGSRRASQAAVCGSNLRQIATANAGYSTENGDYLVPGAPDIWELGGGLVRWHGVRDSIELASDSARFDASRGPLARYLPDARIRACPSFHLTVDGAAANAYELGAGGYGYNQMYVGSRYWAEGYYFRSPGALRGALANEIQQPPLKAMFTDVAMPQSDGQTSWLTEESFCTPPRFLDETGMARPDWGLATPTVHFRHDGRAQVAWCDGHVDGRRMTFTLDGPNVYGADSRSAGIGWFGGGDNSDFAVRGR